jgi:hypothetical protein
MVPSKQLDPIFGELADKVALYPDLLDQIAGSFQPGTREQTIFAVQNLLPAKHHHMVKDVWPQFIEYCK